MNTWLCLVASLPTRNATLRERTWRARKVSGAAVLRDGVYLMPERGDCRAIFDRLKADVCEGGGTVLLARIDEPQDVDFASLLDRSGEYAELLAEIAQVRASLGRTMLPGTLRQVRKLRKAFDTVAGIDFFPGEALRQVEAALNDLELATARASIAEELQDVTGSVVRRDSESACAGSARGSVHAKARAGDAQGERT